MCYLTSVLTEAHLSPSCPLIEANEVFQEFVAIGTEFHYPKELTISYELGNFSVRYHLYSRSLKMKNNIGLSTHPWSTILLSFLHGKNPLNPIFSFLLSNQLSDHKKTLLQFYDNFVSLITLLWNVMEGFWKTYIYSYPLYMHADSFTELEKTS